MGFILKTKRGYFLAENVRSLTRKSGWAINKIRDATPEEIDAYLETRKLSEDMSIMACANPFCDRIVPVPRAQKQKFNTTYMKRYGRFIQVYCSQQCQDIHNKQLGNLVGNQIVAVKVKAKAKAKMKAKPKMRVKVKNIA